ncbi:MAG: SAM-dependent methyltransferase, partial [Gammaproteobacteria bacterium]
NKEDLELLSEMVRFLYYWTLRQDNQIRDLIGLIGGREYSEMTTRKIFQDKWEHLHEGEYTLANPEHRNTIAETVLRWTGQPAEWFNGKQVLDAGCGDGRLSYGLCKLGARVTSLDQSAEGLAKTAEYCGEFPNHKIVQHNLLDPLPMAEQYDLILSFGVLHCTGNTDLAFKNLISKLAPGGVISIMVYGYPRLGKKGDFVHMNRKEFVRQKIRHLPPESAFEFIGNWIKEGDVRGDVRGWFDATAPQVEDHYTEEQVFEMFLEHEMKTIRRLGPEEMRNICVRGEKPLG